MSSTCRTAVLAAMLALEPRFEGGVVPLSEVVMAVRSVSSYAESTIRTHVTSVMCEGAPVHHANHSDDLERVGSGSYRLTDAGRAAARAEDRRTVSPPATPVERGSTPSTDQDWFWEGNVQLAVASHLRTAGWTVVQEADTAARSPGPDLIAARGAASLVVEVNGYPSEVYARGERAGLPKPTRPADQARKWFSHAVLSAMLMRSDHPEALVALAFPDFPTYRGFADRVAPSFERLGFGLWFVDEVGDVEEVVRAALTDDRPSREPDFDALLARCRNLPPTDSIYLATDYVSCLLETVLDFQMHTTSVRRAIAHFNENRWDEIRSLDELQRVLSEFEDTKEGNTALAQYLWGYKLWTRAAMLRALTAFFADQGVSDFEALREWAETSSYERDFRGRVHGLGPAVYNWLVMRLGVETVKPDVHICRFVNETLGRLVSPAETLALLTDVAHVLGVKAYELDWQIWEYQRGQGEKVLGGGDR